jgi:5-hydroxyisourate hydrolase-like protein (transthyretin family)
VTDNVSGLASGTIEISASGSNTWQALPTQKEGSRLVSRIDDATLPPGAYLLRARALDRASNEASTGRRGDGQPMAVTLPLRTAATMHAGFRRTRTVDRRGGGGAVRRRVLAPKTRVRAGETALVMGRLLGPDGHGIVGAEVRVLSSSVIEGEQLVASVTTDANGRYRYTADASTSRKLRFSYTGSALTLPAEKVISMSVPAETSLRVDRNRVLNGQAVNFSGRLQTRPAPAGGKLVELQVRLSDRWQTFRTSRTDEEGRWRIGYHGSRAVNEPEHRHRDGLGKPCPPARRPFPCRTAVRVAVVDSRRAATRRRVHRADRPRGQPVVGAQQQPYRHR